MKLHIKNIYGLSEKKVMANVFFRHYEDDRLGTLFTETQPSLDIEMLRAVMRHVDSTDVAQGTLFFVPVSPETLRYRKFFAQWVKVLHELEKKCAGQFVIQIGQNIPDEALDQRWPDLKKTKAGLALADFGHDFAHVERLAQYDWDYCCFDAKRTVAMSDAGALMICKVNEIRPIAFDVQTQSQSIVSVLSGQDWQQGSYINELSSVDALQPQKKPKVAGAST